MKRDKLKEMIRQSILAELEADGQYEAEKEYGFYNEAETDLEEDLDELLARMSEAEVKEGEDSAIVKLANKVEDLPIVDKLADKIQANPKAMDALNKLAAMYGGSVNEDFGGIDLSTIIKKSQAFADKVNEGDASFTASGVLGGPLLMGLLGLIPGAMETVVQTVNSAVGMAGDGAYEPAFLLSVAGGVLIGAIIDKIKNSLSEGEEEEESLDDILARLTAENLNEAEKMDSETKEILDSLEDLKAQADDEKFKTLLDNALTMVRQHMQGDRKLDLEALKNAIKKGDFKAFAEFQRSVTEAKDEEETDVTVDAEEETDGGEETANDSIVVDKKIVSLSSLPGETRKILDTLETLRAQAEEFGDQKFMTQVGNTITFFTRDFVVAGDEPTKAKVDEAESKELKVGEKVDVFNPKGKYSKESWWGPDEYLNNAEIVNITGEKITVKDINDDEYEIDSSDISKLDESVAFPLWNKIK